METDELDITIGAVFESSAERDQHGGTANVVDGLFAIARALNRVATAINDCRTDHPLMGDTLDTVYQGLTDIAEAIREHPTPK